ncbi:GNAT family N-acetyltransferase [Oharaeibacter diazotrophicus]|uniref:Phosphinothricin acetyltransferase n=1 Tax=Oharaeibacter diazotrophicus TaxID=1920512 RepID=A0A4R6RDM7_9HYPH|nr:GNAT family N-acetyltransferase [Oharaeibacter diazotrophicus]TDP84371.1 phosphinothricin acetyltransferase [Oharaeibacter diazotrophicus]BBE73408.1 N-acyltransferase YncA [Pleomorphomonas sp. SM30]GLS75200.1 N-acetyltransferase [Oharaeibacter diazotrophicus]
MSDVTIRPATPSDLPAIAAIYRDAVLHGTATWELDPPDDAEMLRRFEELTDAGYPYLVAEADGVLAGYAYAGSYRPRAAYRFTVENSIYVAPALHCRGVGRRLLAALIDACTARGFRQMVAVIGDSANAASIGLHTAAGFTPVGVAPAVGWKHGRWLDQMLMRRPLGDGDETPPVG